MTSGPLCKFQDINGVWVEGPLVRIINAATRDPESGDLFTQAIVGIGTDFGTQWLGPFDIEMAGGYRARS